MSHIIDNPAVENDMTDRFICVVYYRERNSADVLQNGMDPIEIWHILGYEAYHETVVPKIVDRLIANNIRRDFATFNSQTRRVSLSDNGRRWATTNCSRFPGVI